MPTPNAGKYRYRAWLYPARCIGYHASKEDPQPIDEMWVDIRPLRASEPVQGDQRQDVTSYEIRTPWRPTVILGQMQLKIQLKTETQEFEIVTAMDSGEMHEELVIQATRINAALSSS